MSWLRRFLIALLAAGVVVRADAGSTEVRIPAASTTSAGVFDAEGRLIRTLWGARKLPAGPVSVDWDGRDDEGRAVPSGGHYIVRVLSHNIRYEWQGVIANTSADVSGPHVHRGFGPINDLAIDNAGNAFYAVGYNEQQSALHRFSTADPQRQSPMGHDDYRRVMRFVATDGVLVYVANVGLVAPRGSFMRDADTFVVALRVTDGTEYSFASGRTVAADRPGNRWNSAIDYEHDDRDLEGRYVQAASGLAVQRTGRYLFVAHDRLDQIRVLDKRDGRVVDVIAAPSPGAMGVAGDDSLWVICGSATQRQVWHYEPGEHGWTRTSTATEGLKRPVALGVSPLDGHVLVADAGTEQLHAFDRQGRAIGRLGRPGGYADGVPDVAPDRLWLSAGPTYVAFQQDGSYWVGDPGNVRNLHYSASGTLLAQIMYLPHSYVVAVDSAKPTRVFAHFLEFSVDYARPLPNSWALVRNWAAAVDHRYRGAFDGLQAVRTFDNGRTYGVVHRYDGSGSEVVELTARGLRPCGFRLESGVKLYADGSLRFHRLRGRELTVYARDPDGFDAMGNPRWKPPRVLGRIEQLDPSDPYYHDVPTVEGVNEPTYPTSTSGVTITFNPGKSQGFHLGGLGSGDSGWRWRASPSGSWHVDPDENPVDGEGRFELGHGVQYGGNVVMSAAGQVIYGYHGEGWNGGQADQWLHFTDSGLYVGRFGRAVYPSTNRTEARPESAGNAFSPQLVTVDGTVYLWHNDEAVHGGIHRWRLAGLDSQRWIEAPVSP
jgi:hypothetical protein